MVINNSGSVEGEETTLTDVVPAGTTFLDGSLFCSSGSCSYDLGTNTVNWFGQVGPGGDTNQSRAGVDDIGSSTVNYIDPPTFSPAGVTTDLCFNITVESPDFEYLDGFDYDLPDDWTVNFVTDVAATSTCGNGHVFGVDVGNQIYWYTNGMPSGCGDWTPGIYDFCANVTVPPACTIGWDLPWNIWGDNYGDPPHSVSGSIPAGCGEPEAPNPVTIEFDVTANACPATVTNVAVIDDPAIPAPVEVSASTDVMCVLEPDITVEPLFLDATLFPDQQETQALNVCNIGNSPLKWSIEEVVTPSGLQAGFGIMVGGLTDSLMRCLGIMDHKPVPNRSGNSYHGFGHQLLVGNRMADDFVITDPGGWQTRQLTFYAYQTGAPLTHHQSQEYIIKFGMAHPDDPDQHDWAW